MNETDLSDEAFEEWRRSVRDWNAGSLLEEFRRRAQIQLEKERREAFEAGFSKALYGTNGIDRDEAYRAFLQERN